MYYCNNCFGRFEQPRRHFEPYPDYGGEWHKACPLCGAPEFYKEEQNDNQGDEDSRGDCPQL